MDYMFAELLTHEQLLNILIERQLNIPNLREMPHDELVRIYKSFALPLARRESHRKTKMQPEFKGLEGKTGKEPINKANECIADLPMDVDGSECIQISSDRFSKTKAGRSISCEKRSHDYKHLNPLTDEYLSIATKRIKIAWS
ncbi:uncharacterized protein LOC129238484 [Anastrepha obliqua]|uniref:uncharacterized protein LOC129238484 n=1 Tax=Anastrepha obliqua TaxID=95512 RepID=UPI00240A5E14|nr:uncharacterized protein LOC129238484 [Anastrepha obliqua]